MNTGTKRWVLIFSLALNAGFLIMAGYGFWVHYLAGPSHLRHTQAIEQTLGELEMPAPISQRAKAEYADFDRKMKQIRADIRATGQVNFKLLAQNSAFDQAAFDENWAKISAFWDQKHDLLYEHLLSMRRILGPEYAPMFFELVVQKTSSEKKR